MNSEANKDKQGKTKPLNSSKTSKTTPVWEEEEDMEVTPDLPVTPSSGGGASKVGMSNLPLDDSSVPPEVIAQAKEILEDLHGLHLRALFEMGSVRAVDWILAK